MHKIDLETAVREILLSSVDQGENATKRSEWPFFFISGAGVSYPSVPLSHEILEECKERAKKKKSPVKQFDDPDKEYKEYTYWLHQAYPSPRDRQKYFRSLIHGKDISHATLRLVQLLESRRIGQIVVTPNFDDLIARGLTLFGVDFQIFDHPATVARVRPNRTDLIQLVHVHGTYWNYDIENLENELGAAAKDRGPYGMLSMMRNLLHTMSPIVVGYAGWENDVIMTSLKEHCQRTQWPYNLYWFCYDEKAVEALPKWLTNHGCVRVVVPQEQTNAYRLRQREKISTDPVIFIPSKAETAKAIHTNPPVPSGQEKGDESGNLKQFFTQLMSIYLPHMESLGVSRFTMSAVDVFEKLIDELDLDSPRITTDPLGLYRDQIRNSIPKQNGEETDRFGFGKVLEKIELAIECVKEYSERESDDDQPPEVEKILEASRRSQPEEMLAAVKALYKKNKLDAIDPPLSRVVAEELLMALRRADPGDTSLDSLLKTLRALAEAHPEDGAVRENLASGLVNAIGHSGSDFERADGLLDELRELVKKHPEDGAVREPLAMGLFNAFNNSEPNSERANKLLDELRELVKKHPEDGAVREPLAKGLNNAIADSGSDFERADGLLDELRKLVKKHPEDREIRWYLASGLFNAIADSGTDFARANGLLDELRKLVEAHPEDGAVREPLAMGLFNAFNNSEPNSERANKLLDELRELVEAHPEDGTVREHLASGLVSSIGHSGPDFSRADGLLDELRELAETHPEDGEIHWYLASGLFNAIADSGTDFARANGLLDELRKLAEAHPEDREIREPLAMAYGASIHIAVVAGDAARAAAMAEALVPLADAVHSQPDIEDLFREAFSDALDLAAERGDAEAERRLMAARRAIFGE